MSQSHQLGRRTLLGALMAVPAVIATGSGAGALSGVPKGRIDSTAGLPADDPGQVLASLRFGMFVHFNPSSVVGREIGWGRNAYRPGEAPGNQFRDPAVKSDPVYDTAYRSFLPEADWAPKLAATAKAAGMTYLVFTTKHHDGYPNFRAGNVDRSFYPDFADTPMGRSGRDLTREIADAARSAGLKLGFYYSPRDWTQPDYAKGDYAAYYTYMMEHLQQLLTQYGKVDFLWYDSIPYADRQPFRPPQLLTVPRDLQPGILINDRAYTNMGFQALPPDLAGDYDTPEQKIGAFNLTRPWESCLTITPPDWSWQPDRRVSDFPTVLKSLVATAVGDGNLLLNVPPMKSGYLEDGVVSTLRQVGDWMGGNKQTIVGTRGGPYRSGDIGGATYAGSTIYLHITGDLRPGRLRLPALNATAKSITTLDGRPVPFTAEARGDVLLDLAGFTKTTPDLILQLTVDKPMSRDFVTDRSMSWGVGATVCEHTGYNGSSVLLPLGSYTAAQLSAGGAAFGISSMRVPRGYRVLGYPGDDFTGSPWTFTTDNPDLGKTGNNDAIKSLKVTFDPAVDFRLINATDGLALDSGGNVPDGSDLKQWTSVDSPNLRWRAEDLGNGYYKLINRTNGMAADGWGSTGNGSPARQSAWTGSPNQQWQITDRGDGRYSIANRTSALVLDGGGQVPSGSVTKQWTWVNSTNLLWTFEPNT
ncbi:alpha-L-fucosidase [Kitasatospora xanthocidica]|uniref:alpha-L-fucosidase n=1 Tax=Kitasatospora xanthocidica TaxID=83382 RepID=UPI0036E4B7DF